MKTLKTVLLTGITLLAFSTSNAQWGNKIKGNGNKVTITRTTSDYDAIKLAGSMDFELVKGNEGKIILKGDSNLLDYIITETKDNTLIVKLKNNTNIAYGKGNKIKITIPFEDIESLTLAGSGDVINKAPIKAKNFMTKVSGSGDMILDLSTTNLDANVTGSGDLKLLGTTENLSAKVTGSGDIDSQKFKSQNTKAKVTGSGTISTTTSNNLNAQVTGSGDINYYGNPANVDKKIIGSGDITKM